MQKLVINAHYTQAEDGLWLATAEVDSDRRVAIYGSDLGVAKGNLREALDGLLVDDEVVRVVDHVSVEEAVTE